MEKKIVNEPKRDRAGQIRSTMARIRNELDQEIGEVEQSARTLLNWRYYTKHHSWACLAAAVAVGYLVVPRKLEIGSPDPETLEKLARKRHLVVEQRPKEEAKGGLVGSAFSLISGLVLKTAMTQFGHQLAILLQPRDDQPDQEPSSSQAPLEGPAPSNRSPMGSH